jgi:transposase
MATVLGPGKKHALIAVGHSMLIVFYHMMRSGLTYADLGGDFFDLLEPQRLRMVLLNREARP